MRAGKGGRTWGAAFIRSVCTALMVRPLLIRHIAGNMITY